LPGENTRRKIPASVVEIYLPGGKTPNEKTPGLMGLPGLKRILSATAKEKAASGSL